MEARDKRVLREAAGFNSEDPVLDLFAGFANDAEVRFGVTVTLVADGVRFTGELADHVEYGEWLDEQMQRGFAGAAERSQDPAQATAATAIAEAFANVKFSAQLDESRQRRHADDAEMQALKEAGESVPDDLRLRVERNHAPEPVLILKNVEIWGPGFMGVQLDYVRIRAANVTAWWFGGRDEDGGE